MQIYIFKKKILNCWRLRPKYYASGSSGTPLMQCGQRHLVRDLVALLQTFIFVSKGVKGDKGDKADKGNREAGETAH